MTLIDFSQRYQIVMYLIFWPIYIYTCIYITIIFCTHIAPFYIWAPAPEELSARPWYP